MKKLKTLLVRGSFLNSFEGQNYELLQDAFDITTVSSLRPIGTIGLKTKKFFALHDLSTNRFFRGIVNRLFGDDQYLLGLEQYVKEHGPFDIAHGAETYFGYMDQLVKFKKQGYVKKIVSTCWEIIPHNNESIVARNQIKKRVIPHIDAFICPTELAKQALVEEGIEEKRIHVIRVGIQIPHQVRDDIFLPLSSRKHEVLSGISTIPTILFVGRLVPEKGIQDFLKMCEGLGIPFKSRVVGSGPLHHLVPVAESVPYSQMSEVYASADVIIIPSKKTKTFQEQYCMVAVEAMAAGLPIIYYNSGALKEVIGSAGISVSEGDVDVLRRQVEKVLSNKKLYTKLSRAAQTRYRRYYSSDIVSSQLDRLYHIVASS